MTRKKSFTYRGGRDYEDAGLNQHTREWKTSESEKREIEAESGRDISDSVNKRNQNLERRNKATMDERKLQDQRLNYRTEEQRQKDSKKFMREHNNSIKKATRDESNFTRNERFRDITSNARNYESADKGKRDWKNHKYLAKVKTKSGKVRYIYKDNRKTSSNGAQLIREKEGNHDRTLDQNYSEEKWTKNDRRRIENETGRDMSGVAARENAELDRKTKLTRDERKLQNVDSRTRGKKTGTGQIQNGSNGKRDDRVKRDEVNEDTRRGEHRAAVNTNSSGASYTNNYIKQYGDTLVSEL